MAEPAQTIFALILVAGALAFLVWRGLRRRGRSACEDAGCGCGKNALKKAEPRK